VHVLIGVHPLLQRVLPRREVIHPAFDRVFIASDGIHHERCGPAIVGERQHRRFAPRRLGAVLVDAAMQQHGGHAIVTVGEDVGLDDHGVARRAFDGIAAAVDVGCDVLDHHALPGVVWQWHDHVRAARGGAAGWRSGVAQGRGRLAGRSGFCGWGRHGWQRRCH
jgi:hypothetical protein